MKRPRFSLRTLGIVVTLVCAYFGAWEATKLQFVGLPSPFDDVVARSSPCPLIIAEDDVGYWWDDGRSLSGTRTYHLWLFGPKFKLPIESVWHEQN